MRSLALALALALALLRGASSVALLTSTAVQPLARTTLSAAIWSTATMPGGVTRPKTVKPPFW